MTDSEHDTPGVPASDDPIEAFREVLAEAVAAGIEDANAMVLSTVSAEGQPSSRVVLLKAVDEGGFVFYTNLESRKGRELAASPRVSLNFFWRETGRQVVVLGTAEPVTDAEADEYFASRPRGSRLGAWASDQSRTLDSRARLVARVAELEAHYLGGAIPRPPHWSGFRVRPHWIEFWKAGRFRLHGRKVYERTDRQGWTTRMLFP